MGTASTRWLGMRLRIGLTLDAVAVPTFAWSRLGIREVTDQRKPLLTSLMFSPLLRAFGRPL
jgi:hypothetical protein